MLLPVISALFTGYVIASYVLARKPQLLHTVKRFPFPALHISHRGGAAENIENSKEAFTFAHAVGTQMFELDCQLTKDLQVVVFHDQSLERCTEGSGSISEYSYDNLPRYKQKLDLNFVPDTFCENSCDQPCQIVRLSDLFETFPTVPINIDIKIDDDRLVEAVSRLIRRYKREKLTIWGGVRWRISRKCMKSNPDVLTYPPPEYVLLIVVSYYLGLLPFLSIPYDCFELPLVSVLRTKHFMKRAKIDTWFGRTFLSVLDYFMMSPGLFRQLRLRGIPVFIWVVNTDCEYQTAFIMGADGVMTDYPTRLRAFLDAHPDLPKAL